MNARDAEALLADAVPRRIGSWADLGAGDGTFARALARLLEPGSRIYAVDRDPRAIASLVRWRGADGGAGAVIPVTADFTRPMDLPGLAMKELDGMLFANALHFVPNPGAVLASLVAWLRPGGRVVIVEYDGRRASRWVPYPIPAARLPEVATDAGLSTPTITATRASAYGGTVYVAAADLDAATPAEGRGERRHR